jgi:hypothetical protein
MGNRFVSLLLAIAIIFSLEYWLFVAWYIAVPLGYLAHLLARYLKYFIRERRHIKSTMAEKRDQISD